MDGGAASMVVVETASQLDQQEDRDNLNVQEVRSSYKLAVIRS